MNYRSFTQTLREIAAYAWAGGLCITTLDFLSLPLLQWRVSLSYFLFVFATLCVAWAEKREFGSRVFLYRLHDALIFSPWKYLLLYFLWISLFSPFTPLPVASLLYAANGWLSLFAVAISAQFIFCERTTQGLVLLPDRLALIFRTYAFTVGGLLTFLLVSLFLPSQALERLIGSQANLFLYFTLGLPFLLWDLVKDGRRLVPRSLSLMVFSVGSVVLLLVGRRYFQLSLGCSVAAVLGLFLYKNIRPRLPTIRIAVVALVAGLGALAAAAALQAREPLRAGLEHIRIAMEAKMRGSFAPALDALWETKLLGKGLGITDVLGVWARVLAEAGLIGFLLYAAFFLALIWDLYRVRRTSRVVVSNIAMVSVAVFLFFASHYVENPYGAYVWIWYSIWALIAATPKKKRSAYR
ncbi:MAG: hypothetical protein EOP11_06375 [Proteobacteria bacterium]|nr:MAG: hypothetical protein EOP11_06375 [Pseudomonadota bacterium]